MTRSFRPSIMNELQQNRIISRTHADQEFIGASRAKKCLSHEQLLTEFFMLNLSFD